jgi:hypothetical protein
MVAPGIRAGQHTWTVVSKLALLDPHRQRGADDVIPAPLGFASQRVTLRVNPDREPRDARIVIDALQRVERLGAATTERPRSTTASL